MNWATTIQPMVTEVTDGIGAVVPAVLVVVGILATVTIGVKLFKRYAK